MVVPKDALDTLVSFYDMLEVDVSAEIQTATASPAALLTLADAVSPNAIRAIGVLYDNELVKTVNGLFDNNPRIASTKKGIELYARERYGSNC